MRAAGIGDRRVALGPLRVAARMPSRGSPPRTVASAVYQRRPSYPDRDVRRGRLLGFARRDGADRARSRRRRGGGRAARPGAFRVLDRGRSRVAAVRLRRAARPRAHGNHGRGRRRAALPAPGGPRNRSAPTSCAPTRSRTRVSTPSTRTPALGLPVDAREYGAAAAILADLGMERVRLMTNNPDKAAALEAHGIRVVERVPVPALPNPINLPLPRNEGAAPGSHPAARRRAAAR